jgi:aspartate carbamoyltransferase catalytic subunit
MWVPKELEKIGAAGTVIRRVSRIEEGLEGADVILVLRVQTERMYEPTLSAGEYILMYQLNTERLRRANPEAIVLHPGPMNRGVEISPEVADGAQSCVLEQVTNGIAVRMALLFLLMSGSTEEVGNPMTDGESSERAASTEKKESTHAAD